MLLFGAIAGSYERGSYERDQNSLEAMEREIEKGFVLRRYRKGLGLPVYAPTGKPQNE
jgi:hypothetical protein